MSPPVGAPLAAVKDGGSAVIPTSADAVGLGNRTQPVASEWLALQSGGMNTIGACMGLDHRGICTLAAPTHLLLEQSLEAAPKTGGAFAGRAGYIS